MVQKKTARRVVAALASAWTLLFVLPHAGLRCQESRTWTRITARDGLSSDSVTCITKDSRGFLWIGTADGLNRYDGYRFNIYKHHSFDPHSLSDNFVTDLLEDRLGNLWIGTVNGLDIFDRQNDRFRHFEPLLWQILTLQRARIYALAQDNQGNLLVAAGGGCFRVSLGSMRVEPLLPASNPPATTAIACDAKDRIWLGTNSGVLVLENGRPTKLAALSGLIPKLDGKDPSALELNINGFFFDTASGLVFVSSSNGLHLLSERAPGRWQAWSYRHDPRRPGSPASDLTWKCLRDTQGALWLGSESDIERVILPAAAPARLRCEVDFAGRGSQLANPARELYEERPGVVWIGSYGSGLIRMAAGEQQFECHRAEERKPGGPAGTSIFTFAEDSRGNIWMGSERGLELFDRRTRTFSLHPGFLKPDDPPPARTIRFILPEADGSLWICTMFMVKRYYPASGRVDNCFYYDTGNAASPMPLVGRYMLRDRTGRLWLASTRGLLEYDAAAGRFRIASDPALRPLAGLYLYTLFEDSRGRLWIGSFINGLYVYTSQGNTGSLRNFVTDAGDFSSISDNTVVCIHQESERTFWIGTRDGLNRMEWPEGRFRRYFEDDGLPNAVIYSILPDAAGGLWMSTNKGLSRLDLRQGGFRNFFLEDGLQNNEFNGNAYLRGRDGTIYLGGIKGLNIIPPEPQNRPGGTIPFVITDFKVFGKPAVSRPLLLEPRPGEGEIVLSYRENFFSIEYALLDFEEAGKKEYAYRMEGIDKEWINAGPRNFASYTNLPPGSYRFRVRGASGLWSGAASLTIRITPPFWKSGWFTLLLVLLGAAALAAGLLYQRLLYRKRMVERELHLKSDLSAMVVHDLRNPLTTIQGFATLLRKKHDAVRLQENLDIIEINAGRMLSLVNDLLDISKFESGKMTIRPDSCRLESLIQEALRMVKPLLLEKELKVDLQIEPAPPLVADGGRIGQVLGNLLGNAIKFSPQGETIGVRLRWLAFEHPPGQQVEIRDRGPGIPAERQRFLFDKYAQLHHAGSDGVQKGTGLGLAVSKLIIDAHGGRIGYERQEGASVFSFFLPEKPSSEKSESTD